MIGKLLEIIWRYWEESGEYWYSWWNFKYIWDSCYPESWVTMFSKDTGSICFQNGSDILMNWKLERMKTLRDTNLLRGIGISVMDWIFSGLSYWYLLYVKKGPEDDCEKKDRKFKMKWVWIGISLRRNSRLYTFMEWIFWNFLVSSGIAGILRK